MMLEIGLFSKITVNTGHTCISHLPFVVHFLGKFNILHFLQCHSRNARSNIHRVLHESVQGAFPGTLLAWGLALLNNTVNLNKQTVSPVAEFSYWCNYDAPDGCWDWRETAWWEPSGEWLSSRRQWIRIRFCFRFIGRSCFVSNAPEPYIQCSSQGVYGAAVPSENSGASLAYLWFCSSQCWLCLLWNVLQGNHHSPDSQPI